MTDMSAETSITGDLPRWALMWLTTGGLFYMAKAAMLRGAELGGWRKAGFALGWIGMDAAPFRRDGGRVKRAGRPFSMGAALFNMVLGVVLLWEVARCFSNPLAAGWIGMVGLVFVLHFGVFGLLAAVWRALGVEVTPIMRCPMAATSLAEFWGRRWNLAFRDLAHRLVFTPVSHRWGHKAALWVSFGISGLVHELVISVPASAGYGLPTAYFLLQALGMSLEHGADRSVRAPFLGWLRTHAFTVLPAFILFHPPFVERVMVPFFHVIGALS